MKKLLPFIFGLAFFLTGDTPNISPSANIEEFVGDFSQVERREIKMGLEEANKKFPLEIKITVLKTKNEEDIGAAFYNLNGDKYFKENYGYNLLKLLRGRNAVALRDFSAYKYSQEGLWNSVYMPNPDSSALYRRAFLHEQGHLIYEKVKTNLLRDELVEIDARNKVAEKESKKQHPGHPSFYTFFYASTECDLEGMKEVNASETFADIFALRVMGFLNNVSDPLLKRKIELIDKTIRDFRD